MYIDRAKTAVPSAKVAGRTKFGSHCPLDEGVGIKVITCHDVGRSIRGILHANDREAHRPWKISISVVDEHGAVLFATLQKSHHSQDQIRICARDVEYVAPSVWGDNNRVGR